MSGVFQSLPMCRLTERIVRSTLVTAWFFADWPTSTSPLRAKATTEGVVREPSELAMTVGSPPSRTATTELVVPRSMPTVRAMVFPPGSCLSKFGSSLPRAGSPGLSPVRSTCSSGPTRGVAAVFPVSRNAPAAQEQPLRLGPMTAPEGGAHRPQLDAAVGALALQVTRETVLQARAALLAEADRLDKNLQRAHRDFGGVGRCGGDPVSPEAADAFDERINALVEQCFTYNRDLRSSA